MRTKEKITDKINKHKIIGLKTDCKYFSNIGNLCSRVGNGMMRCDEYLECEFKYIDALKEENARLKKIKDDFFKQAEISHQAVQDKNKIIQKLETVILEIKQLVSTDYIKTKKQLVQNYDCLDNFMQKIEDKCNEVNQ